MKSVYFRCDANLTIGMGHVMRCLSIADVFSDHGYQPAFILADTSAEKVVEERGFHTIILNTNYQEMENELPKLTFLFEADGSNLFPLLFVDSYFTTTAYLQALREHTFVVYIDDVLKYPYPVDVLLNYNIFAEENAYKELYNNIDVRMPELLLGTKYVPLRKQFRNLPKRGAAKNVKNILISTGGSDPNHIALQLAEYIGGQVYPEEISFHFLLGAMNVDVPELERIAKQNTNIILEQNVTDVAGLMTSCDLAVAASGSTLYELCACGVPIINYSFADNQIEIAKQLEEQGVSRYIGDLRESGNELFCKTVFDSINTLLFNQEKRMKMINNGYSLSDGCGAGRVAETTKIIYNEASAEDSTYINLIEKCVSNWGHDERTERARNYFPVWMQAMPENIRPALATMTQMFDYYSQASVNDDFCLLHEKLLRQGNIYEDNTIYTQVPSNRSRMNSSQGYVSEYFFRNNLNKYSVQLSFQDVKTYLSKYQSIKNLVFIDDFCGTGCTFIDFVNNHLSELQSVHMYYLVIHAMRGAAKEVHDYAVRKNLNVTMLYLFESEKAFGRQELEEISSDEFYINSSLAGVLPDNIFGFQDSESLVSFFNDTPNNTLGIFWQDVNGRSALFPRKNDKFPFRKRKIQRQASNYLASVFENER